MKFIEIQMKLHRNVFNENQNRNLILGDFKMNFESNFNMKTLMILDNKDHVLMIHCTYNIKLQVTS